MLAVSEDVKVIRRGFRAGITAFLPKPLRPEHLHSLLRVIRARPMIERRRSFRLPFRTTVECRSRLDPNPPLRMNSLELSDGGVVLETSRELEVGQELWLEFLLPGDMKPRKLLGKVLRKGPPERIVVDYITLRDRDSKAIQHYLLGPTE